MMPRRILGMMGLFGDHDDEFERETEKYGDQVINEEGMMEIRSAKQRLQEQAQLRKEKLKSLRASRR
jgi:cell division protein FtsZ